MWKKVKNLYLPPFSLIREFGKQNTRGNVSKISVNLTCYRHNGSKSTNYSPLALRRESQKVTLVAVIGGFWSDLSIKRETDVHFGNVSRGFCFPKSRVNENCGNWPLPIGAFQDQYKQTMINKYSNEHNKVKNPNWQEADQLAIYKRSREIELGATENNISYWLERDLNPAPVRILNPAL